MHPFSKGYIGISVHQRLLESSVVYLNLFAVLVEGIRTIYG